MLSSHTLRHTFSSSAHTRLLRKNNLPNDVSQFPSLSQTPYRGRGNHFPSDHGQNVVLKKKFLQRQGGEGGNTAAPRNSIVEM